MPYSSDEVTQRQIVQFSGYDPNIVGDESLRKVERMNFEKLFAGRCSKDEARMISSVIKAMMNVNPGDRPSAS